METKSILIFNALKSQGLLESCIKLTSEPPRGIKANLHMALDHFTQESLEQCTREVKLRMIFFYF